jgi:hypothetical protein
MIVIIGLIILVAAVVAGVAGVLSNSGTGHTLTHHFAVFGYHVTGSTGTLFLYGIVVGALAVFGLSLLLASARRTSRRRNETGRALIQSRRETAAVTQDRDNLIDQRETARAYSAGPPENGAPTTERTPGRQNGSRRGRWHLSGSRSAGPQAADADTANHLSATSVPAGDVTSDASAAAD